MKKEEKSAIRENFTKLTHKKGISLIVLIVTIIVIIILAAVVVLTITNNNPIDNAKKAKILNDIAALKDEIEMQRVKIGYKEEKTDLKLFGSIEELLGDSYKAYSKKYAIEANKLVYKDKVFGAKEISILEENGVEKESKYIEIVNDATKEKEENKDNERIVTLKQFQEKITNKEFSELGYNKAYITEDIDVGAKWNEDGELIAGKEWIPITSIPKGTTLDGDNHKISGIYINTSKQNQGFILNNYGIIENIVIGKECYFLTNYSGIAPIVAINCNDSKIINCVNYADVMSSLTYSWRVGGIISSNKGLAKQCKNYGKINGLHNIGGICGEVYSTSIVEECINYGFVDGTGYKTSGIVGGSDGLGTAKNFGKILKCINYGNVGRYQASGIAGAGFGIMKYCVNYGTINASIQANGIQCGSTIDASNIISDCYNIGVINGPENNSYGIAASNTGLIKSSYNVGKGTGNNYKIVSKSTGTIENSYYLNQTLDDGTILTEEFMKSDEFLRMLGSEYVKDSSGKNSGYPMLKWQE